MNCMAVSAPYTHIQQKLQSEECVVLDGAIATEPRRLRERDRDQAPSGFSRGDDAASRFVAAVLRDKPRARIIAKGGVLAPLNDIRRMTELLDHLVHSPQQRERLGNNGYELCATRNDPGRIAKRYEDLFDEVLQ